MQRGFISLLTYLLTCACLIAADTKEIPIHQIIEIDDAAYLVQMMQDADQKISYRTYPFGAINAPGFYKLANQVTNAISINSSDVTLDLGGQNVSGGIVVQSNLENIIIKDGTVDVQNAVTDAVKINSGCRNITVKDVRVKNATISGIFLNQVSESCIKNCELTSNGTGMQISSCNTIVVEKCNALCSRVEGFSLASSTTCSFTNCKAMSTGQGNQSTTANIFGFVSRNGRGNSFEKCIANSTQGLSVTNFDSLIAGFALRGSETCSNVIRCESSNATASPNGVTMPYGILLENTVGSSLTLTAFPPNPAPSVSGGRTAVAWSPDGRYVAAMIGDINTRAFFKIYEFDRLSLTLTQVAGETVTSAPAGTQFPNRGEWSKSGKYVAFVCQSVAGVPTDNFVFVYEFNRTNNSIKQLWPFTDGANNSERLSIAWSPDEKYFANSGVRSIVAASALIRLYSFDPISQSFSFLFSSNLGTTDVNSGSRALKWSPDGDFLAIGIDALVAAQSTLKVLQLDRINGTLNTVATSASFGGGSFVGAWDLDWSPDGTLIAASTNPSGGRFLVVFLFDRSDNSLTQIGSFGTSGGGSITWSADGNYIIMGITSVSTNIRAYKFTRLSRLSCSITLVASSNLSASVGTQQIRFSPDGQYVAWGSRDGAGTDHVRLYSVLNFPSNNIIRDNLVYSNSGGGIPSGIGISGSSIANLIVNNTCYSNPINSPVIETNYAFVTNVFNSRFQDFPTKNQNLGPFLRKPIGAPPDQIAMLNLLTSKLCDIQTKIELLIAANS